MVQDRADHARRAGRIRARLVFTLIGAVALVAGVFLDWTESLAGYRLTMRSLVQNNFSTRNELLHTVGAVSALIAIVALLSLLDRTGWLTRLAGLAAVVLFAMFAIQVFRHHGEHFSAAYNALRAGAWCQLGGGAVLLLGGLIRYRRKRGRAEPVTAEATAGPLAESASATSPTAALSAEQERERLEADTTVLRPPAPSEIGVGGKPGKEARSANPSG
jgi:hypothetical protein